MLTANARKFFVSEIITNYDEREANNIFSIIEDDVFGLKVNLNEKDIARLNRIIVRLNKNEPIQYILREADFYGLKFKVSNRVLIPRPETEELVNAAIQYVKKTKQKTKNNNLSIFDIGTGSGCIAIVLKKYFPEANVTAIDGCNDALSVAQKNAAFHDAAITFIYEDFLDESKWSTINKFDVIISNPPYITIEEAKNLDDKVRKYEPAVALIALHSNPFIFYEKIALFGLNHLQKNGKIFCELNAKHAKEIAAIFQTKNYTTEIIQDLQYQDRMLVATLNN